MHWLACGERHIPDGSAWLVPREAARAEGYRFTKRRTEYLLRRCAGKRAMASALGWPLEPESLGRIGVLNRVGGAPYIDVDGRRAQVDLSLTDRAGWAVALLGAPGSMSGGTVGVDLEIVEPRSPAFVKDYFTAAEQHYVQTRADSGGSDGHDEAANLIWSAKEAALKVLRVGLRADTRLVEVTLDHSRRRDGWSPLTVASPGRSRFWGWWRRDGVFLLTIAYATPGEPPRKLDTSADLADAVPTHSWLAQPRVQ